MSTFFTLTMASSELANSYPTAYQAEAIDLHKVVPPFDSVQLGFFNSGFTMVFVGDISN